MKRLKLLCISFSVLFLLLTACSQQPDINISETLGKIEEFFRQSEEMDTVSAFDGKKDVKFRIIVEKLPTEEEAIVLFNQIIDRFVKYSNHSDVWDYYNGYFDINSYDNGVIYEANKIIGEDLQVVTK
ncbi:hypothetical protein [Psychrobacillus sp. L3]|uniref:hypothetical protein n=1 Tax=Psychrobacillus sp. L3 TaxID=3236891 RepID=UPI0036F290FE